MNLGLEKFAGGCADACQYASDDSGALVMTEEEDEILVGEVLGSDPEHVSLVTEEMFVGHRTYAALATRAMWSPDAGPSSDAWCLVAVDTSVSPAIIRVKRLVEDDHWWDIQVKDAPWFALSTASGLRKALAGERMVTKAIMPDSDPRLMSKLTDGTPPRIDKEGNI